MKTVSEDDSEEVCEVERIIGKRIAYGAMQYHIKWKDYSSDYNSWEPIENLSCPAIIKKYEARHAAADDKLEWLPMPSKILSSTMIDGKMEYFVRFADGVKSMVSLTFGPMENLINAYEKRQPKPKPTDDKQTTKPTRKATKRRPSPDQNENRDKIRTIEIVDTDIFVDDDDDCLLEHGVGQIRNMRRFGNEIQYHVECHVCNRCEWQPANTVKQLFPQNVIDFYESCIEWEC